MMSRPKLTLLLFAVAVAGLTGCDGNGHKANDPDSLYMKQGYVQAPKFGSVTRLANGGVRVSGRATPDGRVRLTSDQNLAVGGSADGLGVFHIDLPPSREGRLYELAMEDDKRLMLSEGRLFVPPQGVDHIALLRSGAASQPFSARASLVAVIDYDQAGSAAVSGRTQPGAKVTLLADGVPVSSTRADDQGIYSVLLPVSLNNPEAGFRLTAQSNNQSLTRKVVLSRQIPHLSPQQPVVVSYENDGWRVAWMLPGGGAQLSMVY